MNKLNSDQIEKNLQQAVITNNLVKLNSILEALASLQKNGVLIIQYLNCRDTNHRTLIHLAVENSSFDVLQRLLKIKELSLFPHDENDLTPLDMALKINNPNIIETLLHAGAGMFADVNGDISFNINKAQFVLIGFKLNNVTATQNSMRFNKAITSVQQLKTFLNKGDHGLDIPRLLMTCEELKIRAVTETQKKIVAEVTEVLNNATEVLLKERISVNSFASTI